jgi:hypothetical protein
MKARARFTVASMLFVAITISTAEASTGSDQARETLREIQRSASKAADAADSLRQFADRFSVESQYDKLMAVRDDINRMGKDISNLQAESGLTPWEKQAVDRVDTAKDAQDAINFFNENRVDLMGGSIPRLR